MNDSQRKLHHDIRGRLNALKLCVAVLETPMTAKESEEFVVDIERLCDVMCDLMDELGRQNVTPPSSATA